MNSRLFTQKQNSPMKVTVKDITLIGLMIAIIEVSKVLMMNLPNIELTSFWIIMFTLYFGNKILYVIPAFILIEGAMFGVGMWWIMYLYAWPILALITWIFRKKDSVWIWAAISGIFGLMFGLLCSIPYIVLSGVYGAFASWIAGIPYDITHCVGNFVLMMILYHPIRNVMNKVNQFVLN